MKSLRYIALATVLAILTSCYEDLGNYDYLVPEEIKISGIEDQYTAITGIDQLTIQPELTSTDPNAEFECHWFVYPTNTQGTLPVNDTIGRVKDLEYRVGLKPATWQLIFSAKNIHTGYTTYVSSTLQVTTGFSKGWYVSTDNGENSDIHLFLTEDENPLIPTGEVATNVLSTMNNQKTKGTHGVFAFFNNFKTMSEDGYFVNTRALFHYTDKEVSLIDLNTFEVKSTFDDLFFTAPEEKTPGSIIYSNIGFYFNNRSSLHSVYNMAANSGQFGVGLLKDSDGTPYQLSKFFIVNNLASPIFYDELSTSFVGAPNLGTYLYAIKDAKATEMSATNTGKNLLYMQLSNSNPRRAVAVMQDINNPDLKLICKITNISTSSFLINNDTIKSSDKFYNANLYGQNYDDEDLIYFANGNQIWSRSLVNGGEQLQYTLPEDENPVSITHKKYSTDGLNHIAIATQNGNTYTIRLFSKQAGNLKDEPEIIISGEGNFSDLIYMNSTTGVFSYYYLSPWSI